MLSVSVPSVASIRAHQAIGFVLCHHHLLTLLCCQLCRCRGTSRGWGLEVNKANVMISYAQQKQIWYYMHATKSLHVIDS